MIANRFSTLTVSRTKWRNPTKCAQALLPVRMRMEFVLEEK
ncbi:EF-hand domain-containing protein 1, partial [Araneus ventricosus]